jgi:hypothetical protein
LKARKPKKSMKQPRIVSGKEWPASTGLFS